MTSFLIRFQLYILLLVVHVWIKRSDLVQHAFRHDTPLMPYIASTTFSYESVLLPDVS